MLGDVLKIWYNRTLLPLDDWYDLRSLNLAYKKADIPSEGKYISNEEEKAIVYIKGGSIIPYQSIKWGKDQPQTSKNILRKTPVTLIVAPLLDTDVASFTLYYENFTAVRTEGEGDSALGVKVQYMTSQLTFHNTAAMELEEYPYDDIVLREVLVMNGGQYGKARYLCVYDLQGILLLQKDVDPVLPPNYLLILNISIEGEKQVKIGNISRITWEQVDTC